MKKTKVTWISTALTILILITSCGDMLDVKPKDQFDEGSVWGDLALMEVFVNKIYYELPHGLTQSGMSIITDESLLNFDGGSSAITRSLTTPSDYTGWDRSDVGLQMYRWEELYKSIRACNLFLQRVEQNTFSDDAMKNRLTGEVFFLRAFNYHLLAFLYGGVPIITEPYELTDDHLAVRNSFEETIQFISDDLDKAAALLPLTHESSDYGRATKGAALALKSRVLLYAASDLYHDASWTSGYSNPELVSYIGGNRSELWAAARDAAKAVIELNIYDLHNPSGGNVLTNDYEKVFLSKETSEDIFIRSFTAIWQGKGYWDYNPGLYQNPNGYYGWGRKTPLSQYVDSYEMSDGSKFDWTNPQHAASPYENREPRFYANIFYDGAKWRPRPADAVSLDPVGIIQTGYYEQPNGSWLGGLDTRNGPIADFEGTFTGYYLRKFIDPAFDPRFEVQEYPWRHIRYAEVLLNYAEASVELGNDPDAREYLNKIRKRAGLPDNNTGGDELRESIRHERKIELGFEGQRYFDIRRWMIAPQMLLSPSKVDIRYAVNEEKPTYSVLPILGWEREWKDRFYFMPIRLDEINRNKKLIQNPLY